MGVAFSPKGDFFATVGADDEVSYIRIDALCTLY